MSTADVRVGIVSWNTAEELGRCLAALPAALGSLDAEVVVVDNSSEDASVEVAREAGVRVVVNDTNTGYAVAMNQALAGSDASVLVALNPDTEPPPGSLQQLVEVLLDRPSVGVVVPALVGMDGRPQASVNRFPTPLPSLVAAVSTPRLCRSALGRRLLLDGSPPPPSGEVPWAIGAVHVVRTDALQGEAPYDEGSFMYAEDLDLCWRLAQRGWSTWLAADVVIPHAGNAAGAQKWGDTRSQRYWAATYDVVARRRSTLAARVLGVAAAVAALLSVVRSAPQALIGGRRGEHRHQIRQRFAELSVHTRAVLRRY
jgi:N-acetylglucosaminyl-diphospho-decaprenol L-rhamnosyltransferase